MHLVQISLKCELPTIKLIKYKNIKFYILYLINLIVMLLKLNLVIARVRGEMSFLCRIEVDVKVFSYKQAWVEKKNSLIESS